MHIKNYIIADNQELTSLGLQIKEGDVVDFLYFMGGGSLIDN